jgi:hypothetical protein
MRMRLHPAGECEHCIDGSEGLERFYGPLWDAASHFGIMLPVGGKVVAGMSGKKKIKRVAKWLRAAPLTGFDVQYHWSSEWPGTVAEDTRIVAVGRTTEADLGLILEESKDAFWSGFNGWEDLFLFSGSGSDGRLHAYSCHHEEFGSAFGDEALFRSIGVGCRPVHESPENGLDLEPIDSATWRALTQDGDE